MSKPERAGPLKRLWLWTVLLGSLHLSSTPTADAAPGSSECSRCAIYILDIASFAPTEGYPVCDPEKNVVVDPGSGVVYRTEKDTGIRQKASHKYGTHSAPWYLMQVFLHPERLPGSSCHKRRVPPKHIYKNSMSVSLRMQNK